MELLISKGVREGKEMDERETGDLDQAPGTGFRSVKYRSRQPGDRSLTV